MHTECTIQKRENNQIGEKMTFNRTSALAMYGLAVFTFAVLMMAFSVFFGVAITKETMSTILGLIMLGYVLLLAVFIGFSKSDDNKVLRFVLILLMAVDLVAGLSMLTPMFGVGVVDGPRIFTLVILAANAVTGVLLGLLNKSEEKKAKK